MIVEKADATLTKLSVLIQSRGGVSRTSDSRCLNELEVANLYILTAWYSITRISELLMRICGSVMLNRLVNWAVRE